MRNRNVWRRGTFDNAGPHYRFRNFWKTGGSGGGPRDWLASGLALAVSGDRTLPAKPSSDFDVFGLDSPLLAEADMPVPFVPALDLDDARGLHLSSVR